MLNITKPYNGEELTQAMRDGYLEMLREKEAAKQEQYIKAREYYEGVHHVQLTERIRQFLVGGLQANQGLDFNANYCHMVVNAKADRLKLSGFGTEDDSSEKLWEWWKRNRMDRVAGIVHRAAIRDGDAFVLVEWDSVAKMPRFSYNQAFAGDGVMVYYSDERREEIAFASKHWRVSLGAKAGTMRRLNLYFPDRVEKYISKDDVNLGRWMPYMEDENTEIFLGHLGQCGVHWWTDNGTASGLPLGVPIIHFKNNDVGDSFGMSHLANVIPLQDALNKSLIDLVAVQDVEGFGLLVGYGEDWLGVKVGAGAIASTSTSYAEARLERLQGTNPVGMLAVYNAFVTEIARVSGTPLSYLQSSGQVAAEGTMKQQETALIAQVEKAQIDFGNAWEDCMIMGRRLYNAFGDGGMSEDILIDTIWEDATIRNEKEQAEVIAIKVKDLGVSEEQAQRELGYDDTQIAQFKRIKMQNQALAMRQNAAMQNQAPETQMNARNQNMPQSQLRVDENPPPL